MPELAEIFQRFGIALGLGFLIGIEREADKGATFAGVRTFPLISVLGCLSAMLSDGFAPWALPLAFLVIAAFLASSYRVTATPEAPGITTEVSALLTFCYGALVWWNLIVPAAALAVVTVLLLSSKAPLQRLSHRIGRYDLMAAVQFGVITVIILPLLPDRAFGPLQILNPRKIWLFVVLIAALNLIGYVLIKIRGSRQGLALAAAFGGLLSSTALTLSFSRRSRSEPGLAPLFSFGVMLASSIMFLRILVLAFVVAPTVGKFLSLPMLAASGAGLAACLVLWFRRRGDPNEPETGYEPDIRNPCELWSAVGFGLFLAAILFISKGAQQWVGTPGVYASGAVSGLADVNAITLSLSDLANATLSPRVAARGITLAAMANTLVKAAITAGRGGLRRYTFPAFAVVIAVGIAVAFLFL